VIELIKPDVTPAVVIIRWPSKASVVPYAVSDRVGYAVEAALEPVSPPLTRTLGAPVRRHFSPCLSTPARRGEALALQWSDVDVEAGTRRVRGTLANKIAIPKRHKRGTLSNCADALTCSADVGSASHHCTPDTRARLPRDIGDAQEVTA
jgi:hypothetical protein